MRCGLPTDQGVGRRSFDKCGTAFFFGSSLPSLVLCGVVCLVFTLFGVVFVFPHLPLLINFFALLSVIALVWNTDGPLR